MSEEKQREELAMLAGREIERLRNMPQPVVRVCGPLTTGGAGSFEENAERLRHAEAILEKRGLHVFRFDDAEVEIQGRGYEHSLIMEVFHEQVLASRLIHAAYFIPDWDSSKGATWERNFCAAHDIEIREFPEEWFKEQ